jgi:hypothetical protein
MPPEGMTAAAPATAPTSAPTTAPETGQIPAAKTETTPNPSGAPAKDKPTPAEKKHWEVKVNGKVKRMSEEELLARATEADAAQERFREAAQLRKQAEALIGRLRDPHQVIDALMDPSLGLNKNQIRERFEEWYSKEFIETENLTEEQKKLRDAESRLKKYETEEKQRADQKIKDQQESLTAQARDQIQNQIVEALETSGLPKTNFTIRRLAYWMNRNNANGFEAPTEVLVNQVRNEINTSIRDLVEASDGDVLVRLLGDDVIQKLRKYDLEQLRKLRGNGQQPPAEDTPAPVQRNGRAPTSAEVDQRIRTLQRTGRY